VPIARLAEFGFYVLWRSVSGALAGCGSVGQKQQPKAYWPGVWHMLSESYGLLLFFTISFARSLSFDGTDLLRFII
jgi:hypothetical protein